MRRWGRVVVAVVILAGTGVTWGTVSFQLRAAETQLAVGEELTVGIYAMIDGSVAGGTNGLLFWQLDVQVDQSGIVAVKDEPIENVIKAPLPFDSIFSQWESINVDPVNSAVPLTGYVKWLTAQSQSTSQPSTTGLGNYDLIAEITLVGLSPGMVNYALGGNVFFAYDGDQNYHDGVFDSVNSQTEFTVVPEPVTILLFLAGACGVLHRKR